MQLEFFFSRKKKPVHDAGRQRAEVCGGLQYDEEMTQECLRLLTGLGLELRLAGVRVVWNRRMRTTAGRAFWPEGRIEMNPKLHHKQNAGSDSANQEN